MSFHGQLVLLSDSVITQYYNTQVEMSDHKFSVLCFVIVRVLCQNKLSSDYTCIWQFELIFESLTLKTEVWSIKRHWLIGWHSLFSHVTCNISFNIMHGKQCLQVNKRAQSVEETAEIGVWRVEARRRRGDSGMSRLLLFCPCSSSA